MHDNNHPTYDHYDSSDYYDNPPDDHNNNMYDNHNH
jgi:hypothetical protein